MLSRRTFLKSSTLLALAPSVPGFLALTARASRPQPDGRVLVVIQLDGGNDGVNTIVPFGDEGYARNRRQLRLPTERLIRINDQVAFHPALRGAARLLETQRLAIIQGVGYPNPNRSHFTSMKIWQTARLAPDNYHGPGWLGGALDGGRRPADRAPDSVFVGVDSTPRALQGRQSVATALAHLSDFALLGEIDPRRAIPEKEPRAELEAFVRRTMLDGYTTASRLREAASVSDNASYPSTGLASQLRLVARLIKAGFGTQVFYTNQPGYDTHYTQLPFHADLLSALGGALHAFLEDLRSARLEDRVAVLVFSEFGRRAAENGSYGTDHGTAGPVFIAGARVQAGLVGATPSMTDLVSGDLRVGIDFRRIYRTLLEDWLGLGAQQVLGAPFERLPLFRA
jgi:uncharacterized protein (DUF1501 family)